MNQILVGWIQRRVDLEVFCPREDCAADEDVSGERPSYATSSSCINAVAATDAGVAASESAPLPSPLFQPPPMPVTPLPHAPELEKSPFPPAAPTPLEPSCPEIDAAVKPVPEIAGRSNCPMTPSTPVGAAMVRKYIVTQT